MNGKGHPDKLTYAAVHMVPELSKSFLCDRFFFHDLITVNVAKPVLSDNFLTVTFIALFSVPFLVLCLPSPAMLFKNDDLL